MSDLWQTLVLGIIEGITEFLPISSTGHLLVAEHSAWIGPRTDLFNVAIQAGAILAVMGLQDPRNRDYLAKLTVAFLITAIGGFIATKHGFKLPETIKPIAWAMLIGGIAILVIERLLANRPLVTDVTWRVAVCVGLGQIVAGILPGTSRSAATIFAAMLAGLTSRPAATEFAFLVGIPTMFAATGYELLKVRSEAASEDWTALAIGFVASGVVAFVAVKWLLRYIQSHRFTVFAWYRIALGLALLLGAMD